MIIDDKNIYHFQRLLRPILSAYFYYFYFSIYWSASSISL